VIAKNGADRVKFVPKHREIQQLCLTEVVSGRSHQCGKGKSSPHFFRPSIFSQTLRISDAKDTHARRRGHPFDLGWALTLGVEVFDYLREPDEMLRRIEEGDRLGRENSLPFVTEVLAPQIFGTALIRKGQTAEGMALVERSLAVWEVGGGRVANPYWKSVLAEGMAQLGNLSGGLQLIDEAFAQVERPGWEERHYYAEILRIKGWLLSLTGDLAGGERAYIASLDWSRTQQAKSWELRTATSYARLMRNQGRVGEALRTPRADLRLVHRRLRDEGLEGRQGAARRSGRCVGLAGERRRGGRRYCLAREQASETQSLRQSVIATGVSARRLRGRNSHIFSRSRSSVFGGSLPRGKAIGLPCFNRAMPDGFHRAG
jgi:hypothetical protein